MARFGNYVVLQGHVVFPLAGDFFRACFQVCMLRGEADKKARTSRLLLLCMPFRSATHAAIGLLVFAFDTMTIATLAFPPHCSTLSSYNSFSTQATVLFSGSAAGAAALKYIYTLFCLSVHYGATFFIYCSNLWSWALLRGGPASRWRRWPRWLVASGAQFSAIEVQTGVGLFLLVSLNPVLSH